MSKGVPAKAGLAGQASPEPQERLGHSVTIPDAVRRDGQRIMAATLIFIVASWCLVWTFAVDPLLPIWLQVIFNLLALGLIARYVWRGAVR